MKTYSAKLSECKADWWVIDAQDAVLGRLAVEAAKLLKGKHKPMYTPNLDCGDHVVVINAEKVKLTGKKAGKEVFYWHTGHPGGIKERTSEALLAGDHPERVIENAVRRMLSRHKPLGRAQYGKLRVYTGAAHPHEAQKPVAYDLVAKNSKNKRENHG